LKPDVDHPIEDWSDQELIDQYRYIAAELSQEARQSRDDVKARILTEIRRRGLEVPTDSSLTTPGREKAQGALPSQLSS
jgi:hypothetical protein